MFNCIVDTDAGPDDIMALAYLLSRKDVKIEAITIAYGLAHAHKGAANVAKVAALSGKHDISVYVGLQKPLKGDISFPESWRTHAGELPGVDLPTEYATPKTRAATDFLQERLQDASRPVSILALGALTNLASLDKHSVPALVEIVMMGGAFLTPGNVHVTPPISTTAEWNIVVDSLAAKRVFELGVRMLVVPLDATNKVLIDTEFIKAFQRATARNKSPLAYMLHQLFESIRHFVQDGNYYAWDPLAAVAMLERHVVETSNHAVSVGQIEDDSHVGTTRRSDTGPLVSVAYDADQVEFQRLFLEPFEKC